jgi:hypothetical protein
MIAGHALLFAGGASEQGRSLADALEKVPGLGPPQLAAMLGVGESLGDYGRVLPACRELLHDGLSESRALINYQVGFAFILNPVIAVGCRLWRRIGARRCWTLAARWARISPSTIRLHHARLPWVCLLQLLLVLALYFFSVLFLGGPRFVSWLEAALLPAADWMWLRVPWRRKRLQCDFSAMLALLLDANLPEEQAVTLAALSTANAAFIRLGRQAVERLRAGGIWPRRCNALTTPANFMAFEKCGSRWRPLFPGPQRLARMAPCPRLSTRTGGGAIHQHRPAPAQCRQRRVGGGAGHWAAWRKSPPSPSNERSRHSKLRRCRRPTGCA